MGSIAIDEGRTQMRMAIVCGDGLPVSGLLTTLRNVIDLIAATKGCPGIIEYPVPAELGYSWRAQKPQFFQRGPKVTAYPAWMSVSRQVPVEYDGVGDEMLHIRRQVAKAHQLSSEEKSELHKRIEVITIPYERYFTKWFEDHDVDWVIAINMTLSDSVSVTQALYRAGEQRWGSGRPGGIVFWDHDLFGSCGWAEEQGRIYPKQPNEFTPVPQDVPWHLWVLASPVLAMETKQYGTKAEARVSPLVLPSLPQVECDFRSDGIFKAFLRDFELLDRVLDGHPLILCPVRICNVKGVDISIRLLAAVNRLCTKTGQKKAYLLVFGDPDENLEYAAHIRTVIKEEDVSDEIIILGGVPLASTRNGDRVKLDEKDLMALCAATNGGIFFTPPMPDVESVGLGPALAAIAGVPCAVTPFDAFKKCYGPDFHVVTFEMTTEGYQNGAEQFVNDLNQFKESRIGTMGNDNSWCKIVSSNRHILAQNFHNQQWKELLIEMSTGVITDHDTLLRTRKAFGIPQTNGAH